MDVKKFRITAQSHQDKYNHNGEWELELLGISISGFYEVDDELLYFTVHTIGKKKVKNWLGDLESPRLHEFLKDYLTGEVC